MLTWLELTTPGAFGFTFAVAVGTALAMPAWAAVIPELVPRDDLQSAIALNSIAINVSRAIGRRSRAFLSPQWARGWCSR